MTTLKDDITELDRLDRIAAILDRRTKAAKARAAAWEQHVHERMEDEGFDVGDDIKHNGTRWGRQVDWYAKVQDPFEFNSWAEREAPHLVKPKPSMQQLNELVRAAQEDGTPLPPGVGAVPKVWVSRRAA